MSDRYVIQGQIQALKDLITFYKAKPALYEEWEVEHQIEMQIRKYEKQLEGLIEDATEELAEAKG